MMFFPLLPMRIGWALLVAMVLMIGLPSHSAFSSEAWQCPYCGQAFPWDPRDPSGLANFKRGHMSVCPSRPTTPIPQKSQEQKKQEFKAFSDKLRQKLDSEYLHQKEGFRIRLKGVLAEEYTNQQEEFKERFKEGLAKTYQQQQDKFTKRLKKELAKEYEAYLLVPVMPCGFTGVIGTPGCRTAEIIGAIKFASELRKALTGGNAIELISKRVQRAIKVKPVIIRLPSLLIDRIEVMREIVNLEVESINIVVEKLLYDLAHAKAFKGDSPEEAAQKKVEALEHTKKVQKWQREAIEDTKAGKSFQNVTPDKRNQEDNHAKEQQYVIYRPGQAYQDLTDKVKSPFKNWD